MLHDARKQDHLSSATPPSRSPRPRASVILIDPWVATNPRSAPTRHKKLSRVDAIRADALGTATIWATTARDRQGARAAGSGHRSRPANGSRSKRVKNVLPMGKGGTHKGALKHPKPPWSTPYTPTRSQDGQDLALRGRAGRLHRPAYPAA